MKQQYRGGAKIVDKKAKAKIKYFGNATLQLLHGQIPSSCNLVRI